MDCCQSTDFTFVIINIKKTQKYKNFSSPIFGPRSSTDNHIFYFTSSTNQSLGFSINLHIKPYWVRFMADLINKIQCRTRTIITSISCLVYRALFEFKLNYDHTNFGPHKGFPNWQEDLHFISILNRHDGECDYLYGQEEIKITTRALPITYEFIATHS